VAAFASWNGATAVKRWELLTGPEEVDGMRPIDSARSTGFETEIDANWRVWCTPSRDRLHGHVSPPREAVPS
jgi:hypothetical protein